MTQAEKDLQRQCMDYLDEKGYEFIHIPNRVFKGMKNSRLKDWPDLIIFDNGGHTYFVELKTGSKLSVGQAVKNNSLMKKNFPVYIIENFNDFIELF